MSKKFLTKKEVAQMLGISLVTMWRWEKSGHFPTRVQIGVRRVGYHAEAIRLFIESRQAVGGTK